jgi:predicted permease
MSRKLVKRVNGGIAIYYGIASLLAAVAGIIGTIVWLFKIFTDQTDFSWGTLATLVIATAVSGFIGYSILRVGFEELEE